MINDTKSMTDGWLDIAEHYPSPNFNQRPESSQINLLVIHSISLPPSQFGGGNIESFFCNALKTEGHPYFKEIESLCVSAHFLILRTGKIIQFVNIYNRAWHAGRSTFEGQPECNDYSVGIELEGCDHLPFSSQQYTALIELTKQLQIRFPQIANDRITGHNAIAPDRKTDPGYCFNWRYYRNQL